MRYILLLCLLISSLAFADTTTKRYMELPQKQQVPVIQNIINKYRAEGVEPKYTPIEYMRMIDRLMAKNPDYMNVPVGQIFRMILEEEGSLPKDGKVCSPSKYYVDLVMYFLVLDPREIRMFNFQNVRQTPHLELI